MSAIVVENLSKRYVIGHQTQADTLRDALSGGVRSLWTRLRRQRQTREEFYALRDVSFTVEPGEVVGIIGRNGAGKSTLLKILSRITEPTTGRIALNGRVASLLEVGTGFHPELSGRENIFLNGAILGMSRAEIRKKFDEIVAFAEVEKFLDTPVKRYSSGMYVRLAFAVAAHLEPEILIVDEVLAVGDAAFQKKCLGRMKNLTCEEGRTILFVSHNLEALRSICDRGLLLHEGRLEHQNTINDVIARYQSPIINFGVSRPPKLDEPSITSIYLDQSALANHALTVRIGFSSPHLIEAPVAGLVIFSQDGRPLFGTNMRIHPPKQSSARLAEGECRLKVPDLPLHPGIYHLSVWFGDALRDYEHAPEAIVFALPPRNSTQPSPLIDQLGPLDLKCEWAIFPDANTP